MSILRRDVKCGVCGKAMRLGCRCRASVRRAAEQAIAAGKPDPTPHPCPNPGCGRTMRGGVCPGPNC